MRLGSIAFCFILALPASGRSGELQDLGEAMLRILLPVRVTISEETTHITRPLAEDGFVDYLAAVNGLARQNVPNEKNAAILLWQVVGPSVIYEDERQSYFGSADFRSFGIELPNDGTYFRESGPYISALSHEALRVRDGESKGDAESRMMNEQFSAAGKRPWDAKQSPVVQAWLEANEEPLRKIAAAVRRPRYYSPTTRDALPEEYGLLGGVCDYYDPLAQVTCDIARALIARAMLCAGRGQVVDAWRDILTCHRLARLVAQGPLLVHRVYGGIIEENALDATIGLVGHARLDATHLNLLRAKRNGFGGLPSYAEKIDTGERYGYLDIMTRMPRRRLGVFLYLDPTSKPRIVMWWSGKLCLWAADWDSVLRRSNEVFDRAVAIARLPTYAARHAAGAELRSDLFTKWSRARWSASRKWWRIPDSRNLADWLRMKTLPYPLYLRKVATDMISYSIPLLLDHYYCAGRRTWERITAKNRTIDIVIALAAYRLENGAYPEQLDQLKPAFLSGIPTDPFAEGPLRYRRLQTGCLVYSVGPNGEDECGEFDDSVWPDKDDVVAKIAVP